MQVMRVLIIEDNQGDARLFRQWLLDASNTIEQRVQSEQRFQMVVATTLREGAALLQESPRNFDVVLLDLTLSDSMGLDTLHRISAIGAPAAIVVLTGFDDANAGLTAVQHGAQDYLIKGDTDGKLLVRAIRYAIERRRSQLMLAEQSRELAAVQERHRLARELHDSVSQTLFTCSAMAESALRQWDINPTKSRSIMQDVHRLSVTALAEMRVLLLELRPMALTQTTLKQVFLQYLTPLLRHHPFTSELELDEVPPLPADVQVGIYRIAQEAINNIVKHARATQVKIAVEVRGDQLILSIEDDGVGFDPHAASATSLGLDIMEERAKDIGAELRIISMAGRGTRVRVLWRGIGALTNEITSTIRNER